ncbi:MAG TPA: hypothetical protein VFV15_03840, partial [Moraxellaceae bacterium]|nr:hypothetical protein [Moraxellaceae bacterium]
EAHAPHGLSHHLPLAVLLVLSTAVGALIHPPVAGVLPETTPVVTDKGVQHGIELLSAGVALAGIALAVFLFAGQRRFITGLANSGAGRLVGGLWKNAWGFDWLYDRVFVKPFMLVVRATAREWADAGVGAITWVTHKAHDILAKTQSGKLRWYAASMAIGLVLVVAGFALV